MLRCVDRVVSPDTPKAPLTVTVAPDITIEPLEDIDIASVSLAEPILPASGITILPPVVIKPPPAYVLLAVIAPDTPKAPLTVTLAPDITIAPSDAIDIASVSPTEPMLPALGMTRLLARVNNPAPLKDIFSVAAPLVAV